MENAMYLIICYYVSNSSSSLGSFGDISNLSWSIGTSSGSLGHSLVPCATSMGIILDHLGATWTSLQINLGYVGPLEPPWSPHGLLLAHVGLH